MRIRSTRSHPTLLAAAAMSRIQPANPVNSRRKTFVDQDDSEVKTSIEGDNEDEDDIDIEILGGHGLRSRKKPFMPYTDDKLRRKGLSSETAQTSSRRASTRSTSGKKRKSNDSAADDSETITLYSPAPTKKKNAKGSKIMTKDKEAKLSDAEKIEKTLLMVAMDDDTDERDVNEQLTVPIYLSSCENIAGLYDKILQVGEVEDADVRRIKVTFPWKDVNKAIILKRAFEDCYRMIVQEVETAPCWTKGEGICCLQVDIVRKN